MRSPKLLIAFAFSVLVAACGASGQDKARDRAPPLVKAEPATTMRFADRIEAVGTAVANELPTLITLFLIPLLYSRLARYTGSPLAVTRKLEAQLARPGPEPQAAE